MSLTRVTNPMATSIVKVLGDSGGALTRDVAAEIDNLIAWAKNSPRCIHRNTSAVGNVGAGLDTLHSFSLPAGSLATDGDYLQVEYAGAAAGNVTPNTKIINLQAEFDGQVNGLTGAVSRGQSGSWRYTITYIRLNATSVRAKTSLIWGVLLDNTGVNYMFTLSADLTVANLNSNAVTLRVRAESSGTSIANDDITQNLSIIELCQQ